MSVMQLTLLAIAVLCSVLFIEAADVAKDGAKSEDLSSIDQALIASLKESSIVRSAVVDLLIKEYTSQTNPFDCSKSDLLDSAIEAAKLSQTDNEPVEISGHDFLFVGSVGASRNKAALEKHGITHIINWSNTAKCDLFENFHYLCFTGFHGRSGMLSHVEELEKAVEYTKAAIESGGRVLSHCWYGMNRSVTLLVAYLMKEEGFTAVEATDLIKETRPQAAPYWDVLDEYSSRYLEQDIS